MKRPNFIWSYFLTLVLFNLCFFGLQFALVYSQAVSFTRAISFPLNVYLDFITTLGAHLFLYLALSVLQALLFLGIIKRPWHYFSPDQWVVIIWSLCVVAILSANAYYFPLSIFSTFLSPPLPQSLFLVTLIISSSILSFLLINGLFYRKNLYLLVLIITVLIGAHFIHLNQTSYEPIGSKPNIIILGIDSISPEDLNIKNTPFVYQLIQNSTHFTKAISPLARTYPAWTSILTGLYAKHHHVEENLVPRKLVNNKASIVWTLNQLGYNTIYATDDRRFNGIDKEFGFNKIIGPKLGVNDFILGTYNDFPLTNLLINFRISSWPFPYNYTNRASFFSYYPSTFNSLLQQKLAQESKNKPFFLAVHFTLPHWPYAWAETLPEQVNNEFSLAQREFIYQSALQRVDNQFKSFFNFLEQHHYFTNSFLIILSDHGEVLYSPHSRLTNDQNYKGKKPSKFAEYLKKKTSTELDKSTGHGSDILSPKQYHSILAFSIYKNGMRITKKAAIKTRVALIDLAPTILTFLSLNIPNNLDGISLLKSILLPSAPLTDRTFFIESGMFPNQEISEAKALDIGTHFFKIDPTTDQLELRPSKLKAINQQKLYGIIRGDWVLALYPDDKNYIPIIQNLSTGQWSDDLQDAFAKSTPADELKKQIKHYYGKRLYLPFP